MSYKPTSAELHGAHQDEVNRVNAFKRYERVVRSRAHRHAVAPLVQPPMPRAFRTPVPHRYEATRVADHMDPPGGADSTGFGEGCIV